MKIRHDVATHALPGAFLRSCFETEDVGCVFQPEPFVGGSIVKTAGGKLAENRA